MSDEDGKASVRILNEKESHQARKENKKLGIDDFAEAIARMVVAQVCESLGFQSFQQSALNTLSDVGVRYIREVGETANFYANLANRSASNMFDVIQGLEDLVSVQGFSGISDTGNCLLGSVVVRDIIRYIGEVEESPFVYSIPSFPVVKERKPNPSFRQTGENPPDEHVSDWLPKFPDPETYNGLISGNESLTAVNNRIHHIEEQNKKYELLLPNMQQNIISNGYEEGVAVEPGDAAKARLAADTNPFLAPPLQFGEKKVSLSVLPAKLYGEAAGRHQNPIVVENHALAMDPYVPTSEAIWSRPSESKGERRKILFSGRPNVQFKFESSRKSSGMPIGPKNSEIKKIALWFRDDHDGKDEKRKTMKQILQENLQEIAHL